MHGSTTIKKSVISSLSLPPENIPLSLHSRPRHAVKLSFAASLFADPHLNSSCPVAEQQAPRHSVQLPFREKSCAELLGNYLTLGHSVESIHQIIIPTLLSFWILGLLVRAR
jgi:hypothetical protein